jgi:hypothetical protein
MENIIYNILQKMYTIRIHNKIICHKIFVQENGIAGVKFLLAIFMEKINNCTNMELGQNCNLQIQRATVSILCISFWKSNPWRIQAANLVN